MHSLRAFDWYRRRWPWMTLHGVIALILRFFSTNSIALQADCHSGWRYNVRKIVSPMQFQLVFHFWPKLYITHPAARFLCDSWGSILFWNAPGSAESASIEARVGVEIDHMVLGRGHNSLPRTLVSTENLYNFCPKMTCSGALCCN